MIKEYDVLEIGGYSEFSCIGPMCEDDCCKNWDIYIDKNTFLRYSSIKEKDIRESITKKIKVMPQNDNASYAKIKFDSNGKCMVQEEGGLCFIHKNLGEEYLCKTCKVYPKVVNEVYGVMEASYTLSCPEVVRKILFNKDKKEFIMGKKMIDSSILNNKVKDNGSIRDEVFWDVRIVTIGILQDRRYRLWQRILLAGQMFEELDKCKDNKDLIVGVILKYKRLVNDSNLIKIDLPNNIKIKSSLLNEMFQFYKDIVEQSVIDVSRINVSNIEVDENNDYTQIEKMMDSKEYIFENYLVNYVFQSLMPLNKSSYKEQYYNMIFYYGFIMSILGNCFKGKDIKDDEIVKAIYLYSRTVMHSNERLAQIDSIFKEARMYNLVQIALITKF